ncbi:response regulator transcription factor [Rickettsiales bacterium LUAb2]
MRILIVEDDYSVAKIIKLVFKEQNINFDHTINGEEAIEYINAYEYDLIMLDIMLPGNQNGYDVLSYIRENKKLHTPVLMLSGLSDSPKKVISLNKGADDYLTKPFDKQELLARINAIVRRHQGYSSSIIVIGDLKIDIDKRQVTINDKLVPVTTKEYNIVQILALRKGKTVSKESLLDALYNGLDEPEPKIIDVFICKLRKKFKKMSKNSHHYIETIWGQGYNLRDPNGNA